MEVMCLFHFDGSFIIPFMGQSTAIATEYIDVIYTYLQKIDVFYH